MECWFILDFKITFWKFIEEARVTNFRKGDVKTIYIFIIIYLYLIFDNWCTMNLCLFSGESLLSHNNVIHWKQLHNYYIKVPVLQNSNYGHPLAHKAHGTRGERKATIQNHRTVLKRSLAWNLFKIWLIWSLIIIESRSKVSTTLRGDPKIFFLQLLEFQ